MNYTKKFYSKIQKLFFGMGCLLLTLGILVFAFFISKNYIFATYEPSYFNNISEMEGELRYKRSIIVWLDKDGFFAYTTFRRGIYWSYLNKNPYRIKISNGILQSYNFFGFDTKKYAQIPNDPNYDISENFHYIPLKAAKLNSAPSMKKAPVDAKYNSLEFDDEFLRKYYSNFTDYFMEYFKMTAIKRNGNDGPFCFMINSIAPDDVWQMSLELIKKTKPTAGAAIIFYDELDKVNASKIEVLSLAGENLSELPEKLKECKNLKKLFMPFNKIRFTERDISILASLKNLEVLDIRFNDISNSPDPNLMGLKSLKKLKKVYLGGDNFGKHGNVPEVFAEMENVILLSISNAVGIKFSNVYKSREKSLKIFTPYSEILSCP